MPASDTSACPTCHKSVSMRDDSPDRRFYPFCSDRCRLIDLGRWIDEKYQIPAEIDPDDPRGQNEKDYPRMNANEHE